MSNSIYDGVGLINYDQLKIPYKQINGIIVNVESRKCSEEEVKFIALKGQNILFDITKFKRK